MPVSNTSSITKDIKNGEAASLYYFYGHDTASIESFVRWLINKLCPKDAQFMNFHKFEGKGLDIPSLIDACEALPMFAERVVIAINDLRMEDISKEDGDSLRKIVSNLSETTTVIIYSTGVDLYKNKRNLTDKNKRFCDYCAKYGDVVDFAYKTASELGRSIAAALQKNGCAIDKRTAEYLAECCGCDSAYIKQEIDKLSAYAKGRSITKDDIDTICVKHIESDGYELAVNILNNNAKYVYNRLSELAKQDYDAYEIVSIIGFSLTDIYRAKLARSSGLSHSDACRDFGYAKNREFAVKKAYQICGGISLHKIREVLRIMSDTDLTMKTTSLDKKSAMLVLEQRVAECFMAGNGRV
ncbi:DNA polymerase III subunit delta [Ruminococcus albus]|uniref:DNA polymerase III subunit delta n=1 Tax=Ruminococcus albus (strain ATCC 27210 / DSM 20455 / JCM 14654 / NCDO 2250 / 7) TaxID=697329 RepID=E6UAG6_RUMA7|nr:DNA polymerase III subunit delta [Ruminococcus albus]ADU22388.1 DNA polymerase III, delta subunit [Ruminococcus albus 7 = DSM 20455]